MTAAIYRALAAAFGVAASVCLAMRSGLVHRAAQANLAQLQRRAFADWSRSRRTVIHVEAAR